MGNLNTNNDSAAPAHREPRHTYARGSAPLARAYKARRPSRPPVLAQTDMRLHASLIFALVVAHARAATIHGPASPDLEKKLPAPEETNKDVVPAENQSSEQELIDSANTVKDIENNLRVKAVESIPVAVIVENDANPTSDNEVTPDMKRVVDLKNPGEPQRQEHETQNAIHYDEEQQIVTTVKQTVIDTQNALKQGFAGVTQGIQNWIANNEQLSAIQASINNLQESFQNQINKLNDTIQSFWQNRVGSNPQAGNNDPIKPEIQSVESHLKILEDNFQTGVKALSEGVEVFATLKAENENPTSPAPSVPNNLILQYLQMFQQTISQGFSNVTSAFQNYVTQSSNGTSSGLLQGFNNGIQNLLNPGSKPPAGAQSDDANTQRPSLWQGLQSSFSNILKPSQSQAAGSNGGTPNRPITQAIQNLPFVQGVVSLIQPNRPGAQAPSQEQPSKPADTPAAEGSNVVPADTKLESDEPAKAPEAVVKPEQAANTNGPIQTMIQNNPIVKGISGAVQKLQATINNPERPRDTEKETENEKGDTKGGFYHGGYNHNHNTGMEIQF